MALEAWRRVPKQEAMGTRVPAFAARRTALANTRHDDPATRRPIEIRLDVNRGLRKATHQGSARGSRLIDLAQVWTEGYRLVA